MPDRSTALRVFVGDATDDEVREQIASIDAFLSTAAFTDDEAIGLLREAIKTPRSSVEARAASYLLRVLTTRGSATVKAAPTRDTAPSASPTAENRHPTATGTGPDGVTPQSQDLSACNASERGGRRPSMAAGAINTSPPTSGIPMTTPAEDNYQPPLLPPQHAPSAGRPPPYAGHANSSWEMFHCVCEFHLANGATAAELASETDCPKHPRSAVA